MAYTVDDTPAVVERIERDLSTILDQVREADPNLRSLVLTGGFARGEGAVLDGQPQNDYDLVAIRGIGRTRRPYEDVAADLEDALGLHVDLAPVPAWRLGWVSPSIFWYETALRGRVLWGEDLLDRVPVRDPDQLDPAEGLRLLVNRAAGLLLVTRDDDPHAHRIQAAKALLAALDAHILAVDGFPPSQTERWDRFQRLADDGRAPPALREIEPELAWAIRFKTDPAGAADADPREAWRTGARAILSAVPVALDHAGYPSLDAYASRDGLLDHAYYALQAATIPRVRTLVANPTGRVRASTLRLLADSLDGTVDERDAREHLDPLADVDGRPLDVLETLREATLQ